MLKKKIWANFQRIIELFTKKFVKKLLKIWSWDPGSEIRDPGSVKNLFRIPDPGVKKHPIPDPGSGSATLVGNNLEIHKRAIASSKSRLNTQIQFHFYCYQCLVFLVFLLFSPVFFYIYSAQCCGSGSGIRDWVLFDPWIRDPE